MTPEAKLGGETVRHDLRLGFLISKNPIIACTVIEAIYTGSLQATAEIVIQTDKNANNHAIPPFVPVVRLDLDTTESDHKTRTVLEDLGVNLVICTDPELLPGRETIETFDRRILTIEQHTGFSKRQSPVQSGERKAAELYSVYSITKGVAKKIIFIGGGTNPCLMGSEMEYVLNKSIQTGQGIATMLQDILNGKLFLPKIHNPFH